MVRAREFDKKNGRMSASLKGSKLAPGAPGKETS
jgi:hypothetical protein